MTDPVTMAQFFAIAVMAAVAIALLCSSLPSRENWPKAGWGAALVAEAARRAVTLLAPDLARDTPVPPDTVQFLVMCGFFVAAAFGRGRHATAWISASLAISVVAAVAAAYRPGYAAVFAAVALVLAGTATWRWWRATMMIAATAIFAWGGLALAAASGSHDILEPASMALATGLLAVASGLAILTDLTVPTRNSRIRSTGVKRIPRRRRDPVTGEGETPEWPPEESRAVDDEDDDALRRRHDEINRLLDTTLSSMAEGLVAVGANSRVLLINDALRRFLDLDDADAPEGKDFKVILREVAERGDLGPGDPVAAADAFIDHIRVLAGSQEPAFEWTLPDGRACLVSSDPLPGGGMIATFTDVTEQRNALWIMAQARDAAERGNKAKTEFLTRMSHELRTPLNSIIGFAGMLRDEALGPIGVADYRVFANDIGASGQSLLSQINAILDVARLEAGTLGLTEAIIDPRAVLETTIATAETVASVREIGFSYFLAPDLPAIRADR